MPVPELFKSEAWRMLNHTILSTSNCGNPSLRLFGFGPVVVDGYGLGYIIKDNSIHYSISSKRRQTGHFALALNGVLKGMAKLLRRKGVGAHCTSFKAALHAFQKPESYGNMWGQSRDNSAVRSNKTVDRWIEEEEDHAEKSRTKV